MENKKNILFENTSRKLPFTVPENYFEEFAAGIDQAIAHKPVKKLASIRSWLYIAAMLTGLIIMSKAGYNIYVNHEITNSENYELYVISQLHEDEVMDLYLANETK